MKKYSRYFWLAGLGIVFSVASYFLEVFHVAQWWNGFLSNVGAGFAGALLTVFFIDQRIEKQRDKELNRVRGVAFDRLRIALLHHISLLLQFQKASALKVPEKKAGAIGDLFGDEFYSTLGALDFYQPAPVVPKQLWIHYTASQAEVFRGALEKMLDAYMAVLEPRTIETIEKLRGSSVLQFLATAHYTMAADKETGFKRPFETVLGSMGKTLREHNKYLVELVAQYNEYATVPMLADQFDWVWRADISPKLGSGRVTMAKYPGGPI